MDSLDTKKKQHSDAPDAPRVRVTAPVRGKKEAELILMQIEMWKAQGTFLGQLQKKLAEAMEQSGTDSSSSTCAPWPTSCSGTTPSKEQDK